MSDWRGDAEEAQAFLEHMPIETDAWGNVHRSHYPRLAVLLRRARATALTDAIAVLQALRLPEIDSTVEHCERCSDPAVQVDAYGVALCAQCALDALEELQGMVETVPA